MPLLNLALQGGGSHGAFTWGVLDALLEDGGLAIEGVGGASAGALNAVALAGGWAAAQAAGRDPREGARECLAAVWGQVSAWGSLAGLQQIARLLWGGLPLVSPYQANPLGLNPLRELVRSRIDFEAIAAHPVLKVFVSATHVTTGKAVIFTGTRLGVDAVLASACLPMLFHAVEIDGESCWDGGYSANPPLSPLVTRCAGADLVLVQLNPLRQRVLPRSTAEIAERTNELTFNASLLTQMRAIAFVNALVEDGTLAPGRCKFVRVHRIDGGTALAGLPPFSRTVPDAVMIARLHQAGRTAGRAWLAQHGGHRGRLPGRHRGGSPTGAGAVAVVEMAVTPAEIGIRSRFP